MPSDKLDDLEATVRQRMRLTADEQMVMRYVDEENEEIVLVDDSDLATCTSLYREHNWTIIQLQVEVGGRRRAPTSTVLQSRAQSMTIDATKPQRTLNSSQIDDFSLWDHLPSTADDMFDANKMALPVAVGVVLLGLLLARKER